MVETAPESLIGLLGGPAGVAIGAAAEMGAGSAADIDNARVGDDFITDVTKQLGPNRTALVAEIEEDWTTPVDTRKEAIGRPASNSKREGPELSEEFFYENSTSFREQMALKCPNPESVTFRREICPDASLRLASGLK